MTTDTPWTWMAAWMRHGTDSLRHRRCSLLATEEYSGSAPGGYHASLGAQAPGATPVVAAARATSRPAAAGVVPVTAA
jgi:hypothetical protein